PLQHRRNAIGVSGFIILIAAIFLVISTVAWLLYGYEYAVREAPTSELTMEPVETGEPEQSAEPETSVQEADNNSAPTE
ncbi:hypothetical protein ACFLRC_04980, partial [Candidatus Altiarchaeota archaeon]